MYIKYLQLRNYRNYTELFLEFNKSVNVFIGDNAQGKTNILESIYYCSIGRSHRTNKDKELISWDKNEAYIQSYIARERLDKKIEIKIFKEGRKGININKIKVNKISELLGNFNVVMFSPEDLKIVKESPSYRRKFLDIELCKLSRMYYYNLVQYNKVLEEKNILLRKWNEKNIGILEIYNEQLSKFGSEIIKQRKNYIDKLNNIGNDIHKKISNATEQIQFKYITSVKNIDEAENQLLLNFKKNMERDIEKRVTSEGPHRDDFQVLINDIDAKTFGSQGQQRTAVLTIKFASLEIIKETIGEYPVLLLDDVLSELDSKRQEYILSSIKNIQTMITCTGIEEINNLLSDSSYVFKVTKGVVEKIEN
jgi:DNA replication and repair protein RecF